MNAFQLKCMACLFMLIDHAAVMLVNVTSPVFIYFRMAGRLAFPIFAYMIANGYRHTVDRGRYLMRLVLFALLIQIVYGLMIKNGGINIFATLSLGLLSIMGWDEVTGERVWSPLGAAVVLAAAAVAQLLGMDYGAYGVLLIFSCHLLYGRIAPLALVWTALAVGAHQLHWVGQTQLLAVCALLFIALYDESRGPGGFWAKWGFYLFYCLHLPLLYGIAVLV